MGRSRSPGRPTTPEDGTCESVRLPGGRTIGFADLGDPRGLPLVFFHGTPGSRLDALLLSEAARRAGVRLIAPDRPGYGLSDAASLTVAGWVADVRSLADSLGIDHFAVGGISGGGPYALACGALIPERVWAAAVVAGAPPPDLKGDVSQMHAANRMAETINSRAPSLNRMVDGVLALVVGYAPGIYLRLGMRLLPPADRRVFSDPTVQKVFLQSAREQFRQGAAGISGDRRLDRPWGFKLSDVAVPVFQWHGDDDRNVPFADGQTMAEQIPDNTFEVIRGGGHLLLPGHSTAVMTALTSIADPSSID